MFYEKGFSLIEILISFLLLAVFTLGLDAMQLAALQEAKSVYYFNIGMQQMNNVVETLKILKQNFHPHVLKNWNIQNSQLLPQGKGIVTGKYPNYSIQLLWGNQSKCQQNKIGKTNCLTMKVAI